MPAFPPDTTPYVSRTWDGAGWAETTTPASVKQIWTIEPGPADQPNLLYAGVEPAALFLSHDNGVTWENCDALWRHSTRDRWFPDGSGGMMLQTVQIDPADARHLYVAIASAGVFESHDAGVSWEPLSRGLDQTPLYHSVYRQALTHDGGTPLGLYLGTSGGRLFASRDGGDSWSLLLDYLPPVTSLRAAIIKA